MTEQQRARILEWIAYHRETQIRLYRDPEAAPMRAEMHRVVCEALQKVLSGELLGSQAEAWFLQQMEPMKAYVSLGKDAGMQWVLEMAYRCQCEDGARYVASNLREALER